MPGAEFCSMARNHLLIRTDKRSETALKYMASEGGSQGIGVLAESSLHAALKQWYSKSGDLLEVPVDGFVIDIVRGNLLIEVQTNNFSAIKQKLMTLIRSHPVRLVHPLAHEKWIVRENLDGSVELGKRRSPKRKSLENLFEELVSLPELVAHQNFSLEILLTREEEIRRNDGKGSWRRKGWSIVDRRLVEVIDQYLFERPEDFLVFIPDSLTRPFTNAELAKAIDKPRWLVQKMTYCLRKMGAITVCGKRRRAFLHTDRNSKQPQI